MIDNRSQIRQFLAYRTKSLFTALQSSPAVPDASSPRKSSDDSLEVVDQKRHGRHISASDALCGQMFASGTFAPSEQHKGDHQIIKNASDLHPNSAELATPVRYKNKQSNKAGRLLVKRLLGSGRRVGKSTSSLYSKYVRKLQHARTPSADSRQDTSEVTEVDELPAYISLKKRQSVIYEDAIESAGSSSSSLETLESNASRSQAPQNFSLPTPPSSTYGDRDSSTHIIGHAPLTPPRSPSEQRTLPLSNHTSYPFPSSLDSPVSPSTVISGSVAPRGRVRARAPTHQSTPSDPDSPPRLTSTNKSPRLRLFPTPTPVESIPLPAYKRLSLYPDSNGSTLHPLAQIPGRRLSISTVSSAPQLGATPAPLTRNHNRNSLPAPVSMPSHMSPEPTKSEEDKATANLREWELATFALRYEDTAILGEPFHTAKAAELWMNTRGVNGFGRRRRREF